MESTKALNAYEYVAIVVPGAIVTLGVAFTFPAVKATLGDKFSLGEFGVFLIVSFAVGHVTQAIGNIFESLIWFTIGRPSDLPRRRKQNLLTDRQRASLERKAGDLEGEATPLPAMSRAAWAMIVPRIYVAVRSAGRNERIDAFNRTYGLLRGISVAFYLSAVWLALNHGDPRLIGLAAASALAATWRMFRAGRNYARELFLTYLDLPATSVPLTAVAD